jgi:GNAT superfamily N-acetyltransferase
MGRIRKMEMADIDQVVKIWRDQYQREHPDKSPKDVDDVYSKLKDRILPYAIETSNAYVWYSDGPIRAFMTFQPGGDPPYMMDNLYVEYGWQSQGIGTDLMRKAQKLHSEIVLDVFRGAPALKAYAKWCFKIVYLRKNPDRDQKFRMKWSREAPPA